VKSPNGWKRNQTIEISRRGEFVVIEPSFNFDDFDPEAVAIHFHQSEYIKLHSFLDNWLNLEKPSEEGLRK